MPVPTAIYPDPNAFLARRRQELGLSPADLALKAGFGSSKVHASVIDMIERGKAQIPLARCRELALALDVDPVWFVMCVLWKQEPDTAEVLQGALDRVQRVG